MDPELLFSCPTRLDRNSTWEWYSKTEFRILSIGLLFDYDTITSNSKLNIISALCEYLNSYVKARIEFYGEHKKANNFGQFSMVQPSRETEPHKYEWHSRQWYITEQQQVDAAFKILHLTQKCESYTAKEIAFKLVDYVGFYNEENKAETRVQTYSCNNVIDYHSILGIEPIFHLPDSKSKRITQKLLTHFVEHLMLKCFFGLHEGWRLYASDGKIYYKWSSLDYHGNTEDEADTMLSSTDSDSSD